MLEIFKPRKSKYGLRTTVTLTSLMMCARLQRDLSDQGEYGKDYWIEIEVKRYSSVADFTLYVNSDHIFEYVTSSEITNER